jgi:N-acetylglucosamine-6-phosphate deacetylase
MQSRAALKSRHPERSRGIPRCNFRGNATGSLDFARDDWIIDLVIFTHARVILSDEIRDDLDVVVRDGRIAELRPRGRSTDAINLGGKYLSPGFVDIHVHGAQGRDTMEGIAEALRAICDFHLSGGTTSLLLTTATAPLDRIVSVLEAVKTAKVPHIAGVHVEGPFISREKAGAQRQEFICEPTADNISRLLKHRDVIKRITVAPEINGALELIMKFVAAGVSVSGGHSNAWDEEARVAFEHGMRSVTHSFNCMSSARHRGIDRVAGLLEFALSEPEISCELIADGYHVSPTLMKLLCRAKGAEKILLVTDATAGAGLPEGTFFELGGRECVVQNGRCLLADKSALAGSTATMIDLVYAMVNEVGVPLHEAIAMAARNPAREIGLAGKGEIAVGKDADLLVLSPALEVERVYLSGVLSSEMGA